MPRVHGGFLLRAGPLSLLIDPSAGQPVMTPPVVIGGFYFFAPKSGGTKTQKF